MMSDISDNNDDSFESMMEKSLSGMKRMEPGEMIETEIVSISGGYIFLQLSGKSEGLLEASELSDKDGNITVKVGETIRVFFLAVQNGDMVFTTKISGEKAGRAVLENAFENGIPVEGSVSKEIKGGFEIKVGDTRAFCPFSQMGKKRVEDAQQYVGKTMTFKIIELSENGRNVLVSHRAILEADHKEHIEALKLTLKEKMVVKGKIVSIREFGAFVDLNGVQALLPISEISRSRIEDISKVVSVGDEIEAVLIKLDWAKERITLSMKALLGDPWDEAPTKYKVGSKHTGKIVRIENFGAFVSLEPGIDGLVHVSELPKDSQENDSRELIKKGESIEVLINGLDIEKKRVSLKLVSSSKEDEAFAEYSEPESDSYNPFADFFNKK